MKYKNVVFDFGNVIGRFDGRYMLEQFCQSPKDCDLLMPVVYARWQELDKGTVGYEEYVEHTVSAVPARLEETVRSFFRGWPELVSPIRDTEIKHILKNALTDEIDSRDVYMKGIDHSYYYEGYTAFKAEEL